MGVEAAIQGRVPCHPRVSPHHPQPPVGEEGSGLEVEVHRSQEQSDVQPDRLWTADGRQVGSEVTSQPGPGPRVGWTDGPASARPYEHGQQDKDYSRVERHDENEPQT